MYLHPPLTSIYSNRNRIAHNLQYCFHLKQKSITDPKIRLKPRRSNHHTMRHSPESDRPKIDVCSIKKSWNYHSYFNLYTVTNDMPCIDQKKSKKLAVNTVRQRSCPFLKPVILQCNSSYTWFISTLN